MKRPTVVCAVAFIAVCAWSGAPAQAGISVGAFIPPWEETITYRQDIQAFNLGTRKSHAIILFYRGFEYTEPDNIYLLSQCRDAGAVPFVNCVSGSWSYASIYGGTRDAYFQTMAGAFRDFGGRILLCIDSEMNLSTNSPSSFIRMWRRVHDIFTTAGATNIEWVWSPNCLPLNHAEYYPGDQYVDWVGTEGFCWKDGALAASFFGPILSSFASSYPQKPAIISYMGGDTDKASDKPRWIENAYSALKGYGNLKAIVWWNDSVVRNEDGVDVIYDFRVYPTAYKTGAVPADVTTAYRNAIASAPYISTLPPYSDLTDGGGGPSGVSITPSPATISRGSTLSLNWVISGISQRIDAYLAAKTPDGGLYIADSGLRWSTRIRPVAGGFNPGGDAAGSLQFQIPAGISEGIYTFEAVVVPEGAAVMSPGNWLGGGMSSAPVTVR